MTFSDAPSTNPPSAAAPPATQASVPAPQVAPPKPKAKPSDPPAEPAALEATSAALVREIVDVYRPKLVEALARDQSCRNSPGVDSCALEATIGTHYTIALQAAALEKALQDLLPAEPDVMSLADETIAQLHKTVELEKPVLSCAVPITDGNSSTPLSDCADEVTSAQQEYPGLANVLERWNN